MELHTAREEILKKTMNGIGVSSVASHFESIIEQGMDEYSRLVALAYHDWKGHNMYYFDVRKKAYFSKRQEGLRDEEIDYITPDELFKHFLNDPEIIINK